MAQILVRWKKAQDMKYGRRRLPIQAQEAIVKGHPERFAVYQVPSTFLTTMWALADLKEEGGTSTYYLYADGWESARKQAAKRIHEILSPKPKAAPKARAKRATASRAPSRRPSA